MRFFRQMQIKLRQRKAVTLPEMLVAVAILVVLLALVSPPLVTMAKGLKMTEMDDYARVIYGEVQNRLTSMKASGQLKEFRELLASDDYRSTHNLGELNCCPQDYDEETDDLWRNIYFVTSNAADDALLRYIIGPGFVKSGLSGSYAVELDPITGNVYGVFYAENSFSYLSRVYTDLGPSAAARARELRANYQLGYYNGTMDTETVISLDLEQRLEVINADELYLRLSYRINTIQDSVRKLNIRVTVSDQHGGTYIKDLTGADLIQVGETGTVCVLLDSMMEGYDFATITGLTPGDNLTVRAFCDYRNSIYAYTNTADVGSGESGHAVSSLFAQRDGERLQVSYSRHLRNLDESIFTGYTGAAPLAVTQIKSIDFNDHTTFAWTIDAYGNPVYMPNIARNPLSSFPPLANSHLNNGSYDGSYRELVNFPIAQGSVGSGLFSSLTGTALANVRLVDCSVSGSGNSGALVGVMNGGSVTDCGVHLTVTDAGGNRYSTFPATEGTYENLMAQRQAYYTVSGGNQAGSTQIGGLIGAATDVDFIEAFAAINVSGNSQVGGLVGVAGEGCTFVNCYASGDVSASSQTGGLIGSASGPVTVATCYSTSDVTAVSQAGGILGAYVPGTSINDCRYYGQLLNSTGTAVPTQSGGIVGDGAGASCTDCRYLFQTSYNMDGLNDLAGSSAKQRYSSLQRPAGMDAVSSYPYYFELAGAFPFPAVCDEHWGDWPVRFTLKAALVYYEKYEDGSFGYYCKTGFAGSESAESGNYWLLDTLRSSGYCIEDGYALATVYNLTSFACQLNSDRKATLTKSATAGSGYFVEIARPVDVEFRYVENNAPTIDYMTMSYLYLYQLPYELQMPNRDTQAKFFDQLKITAGYAVGQNSGDTPALSSYTFYYNGHFAKNAINPDPEHPDATKVWPDPQEISVRSARQLNCLGRFFFYWDPGYWKDVSGNQYSQVTYNQELDISFSAYVTGYCGKATYDLMETDSANPDRNVPIGRSRVATLAGHGNFKPGNFKNNYDGHSHLIIDFRLESGQIQYMGLFGEVEGPFRPTASDTDTAVLRNIIMVTDPNSEDRGYVRNTWNGVLNTNRAGTGALAGKLHRSNTNSANASSSYFSEVLITNCIVAGYEVSWSGSITAKYNAATGAMVGFNLGRVENSAAIGCMTSIAYTGGDGSGSMGVGGLVGSNMGDITNCYAGGTLSLLASNAAVAARSTMGGICGATIHTNSNMTNPFPAITVSDCYAYCTVDADNTSATVKFYGVTSGLFGGKDGKGGDGDNTARVKGAITITNCYYVNDILAEEVNLIPAAAGYGEDGSVTQVTGSNNQYYNVQVTALDYTAYKAYCAGNAADAAVAAEDSHPWSQRLSADDPNDYPYSGGAYAYPFRGIVQRVNDAGAFTDYIHYGDWPAPPAGQVVYWEQYDNADYGFYYVDSKNVVQNTLIPDAENARVITGSGYGFLLNEGALIEDVTLTVEGLAVSALADAYTYYPTDLGKLYPMTAAAVEALSANAAGTALRVAANSRATTIYVNAGFAAAISPVAETGWGSADHPLLVRSQAQLYQVGRYEAALCYSQTHNITVTAARPAELSRSLSAGSVFDGNGQASESGNTVSGLLQPLFTYNNGTLRNVNLADVNLNGSGNQAALATTNASSGLVENCRVSGAVTSTDGDAAGLVHSNTGSLTGCRAENVTVTAAGSAAGLVRSNSHILSDCLVANATVIGNGDCAGLLVESTAGGSGTEANLSGCRVSDSHITSNGANAAGLVWRCDHALTGVAQEALVSASTVTAAVSAAGLAGSSIALTDCLVNITTVTAASGNAAGLTIEAVGPLQACIVTDGSVTATVGDAAGLALESAAEAVADACRVEASQVTAGGSAAGFILTANAALRNCAVTGQGMAVHGVRDAAGLCVTANQTVGACTVQSAVLSDSTNAAGLLLTANQAVNGSCQVSDSTVTATTGRAAGLILTANQTVSGCSVTNSAVSAQTNAAGLLHTAATQAVSGCHVNGGSVIAASGQAAGLVIEAYAPLFQCGVSDVTVQGASAAGLAGVAQTVSVCTVRGGSVTAGNATTGHAAGLLLTANDAVTDSHVSANTGSTLYITSANGNAAGFVYTSNASGAVSGCTVAQLSVSATNGGAAGFIHTNQGSGAVSGCTASQLSVSATDGNAAGFICTNNASGTVSSCTVSQLSVTATGDAAGFIHTNNAPLTDCGVQATTAQPISVNSRDGVAAGFIRTNSGQVSGCYARAENAYADLTVSGLDAAGFIASNNGNLSASYGVGQVTASATAAGFSLSAGAVRGCYADCLVVAPTAAGFALSSYDAAESFAAGEVQASIAGFGFLQSGSAENCYSVAALTGSGSQTGFSAGYNSTGCYWGRNPALLQQGYAGHNANITDSSGATCLTLNDLADVTMGGAVWGAAASHPYTLSGSYPYPMPGVDYWGDWPVGQELEPRGQLGVVIVTGVRQSIFPLIVSYSYAAYSYDLASDTFIEDGSLLSGFDLEPLHEDNSFIGMLESLFTPSWLYVFYSDDLQPAYDAYWQVTPTDSFSLSNSAIDCGSYTCLELTQNGTATACGLTFLNQYDNSSFILRVQRTGYNWSYVSHE